MKAARSGPRAQTSKPLFQVTIPPPSSLGAPITRTSPLAATYCCSWPPPRTTTILQQSCNFCARRHPTVTIVTFCPHCHHHSYLHIQHSHQSPSLLSPDCRHKLLLPSSTVTSISTHRTFYSPQSWLLLALVLHSAVKQCFCLCSTLFAQSDCTAASA